MAVLPISRANLNTSAQKATSKPLVLLCCLVFLSASFWPTATFSQTGGEASLRALIAREFMARELQALSTAEEAEDNTSAAQHRQRAILLLQSLLESADTRYNTAALLFNLGILNEQAGHMGKAQAFFLASAEQQSSPATQAKIAQIRKQVGEISQRPIWSIRSLLMQRLIDDHSLMLLIASLFGSFWLVLAVRLYQNAAALRWTAWTMGIGLALLMILWGGRQMDLGHGTEAVVLQDTPLKKRPLHTSPLHAQQAKAGQEIYITARFGDYVRFIPKRAGEAVWGGKEVWIKRRDLHIR